MKRNVSFRVFAAAGFTLTLIGLGGFLARLDAAETPFGIAANAAYVRPNPTHLWHLVRGHHWQIVAHESEPTAETDAREQNGGACGPGMVEVKGNMKTDPPRKSLYDGNSVEEMQKKTCTKWINREYPERCQSFDRAAWLKMSEKLPQKPMDFCMDRFEYPNIKGDFPVIMVSFPEAQNMCAEEGKRLCTEDEWTFACEGEEATPYPYGYERSADKCVIDAHWRPYDEKALRPREGTEAMVELDKLWQGVPSGSRPECRSPFGVYDMTGNVDEWTHTVREGERPSILKGGYWGPVRTRCRPSTRSHDETHVFYQQGFRCCSDVGAKVTPPIEPEGAVMGPDPGGAIDESILGDKIGAAKKALEGALPAQSTVSPVTPPPVAPPSADAE
jgi:hypothetical protein